MTDKSVSPSPPPPSEEPYGPENPPLHTPYNWMQRYQNATPFGRWLLLKLANTYPRMGLAEFLHQVEGVMPYGSRNPSRSKIYNWLGTRFTHLYYFDIEGIATVLRVSEAEVLAHYNASVYANREPTAEELQRAHKEYYYGQFSRLTTDNQRMVRAMVHTLLREQRERPNEGPPLPLQTGLYP